MSIGPAPVICDECGATKGKANKWLFGYESEPDSNCPVVLIGTRNQVGEHDALNLGPWLASRRDWCSEKCAMAAVSKKLTAIRASEAKDSAEGKQVRQAQTPENDQKESIPDGSRVQGRTQEED